MLIKTDSPGFVKDSSSGAIINTNTSEYNRVLVERERVKEHNDLKNTLKTLELEFREIKELLSQIIRK